METIGYNPIQLDPKSNNIRGNARGGSNYADELYPDDGRYSRGKASDHKGNWGKHSDGDRHNDGYTEHYSDGGACESGNNYTGDDTGGWSIAGGGEV